MPAADLGPQGESRPARADQPGLPADNVSVPRTDHVPPGAPGGDPPSHGGSRSREQGATVSRERSRTPAPKSHQVCWSNWVDDLYDDDGVGDWLERVPEEDVGNLLDLSDGDLGQRGVGSFDAASVKTGCFANSVDTEGVWEPLPETSGPMKFADHESYFCHAMESQSKVFEISMGLQARDVHQVRQGSTTQWVLNEKPKKRAEVQFRSLTEADKMEFLGAMKNELSSYLEHEAVAIASRHNVPKERILGMRWVLSWKTVTDETNGSIVGHKPKARLIIRGYQDPDILHLKRDSPTLNTQKRNMILGLAACHGWSCFVGDVKTAFLNGDNTEAARQIFAEPPEEVKHMLGLKPHELFRIMKAVYGLLHAPKAWSDKLGKELRQQGWIQSKLEPCVWRLYEGGVLQGLIGIHVDDLLCTGSGDYFMSKIRTLRECFPFGSWKDLKKGVCYFLWL